MNVLVTGGAGYVGSHAVRILKAAGHNPVILDSLVRGHRQVAEILGVAAVWADLRDVATVETTLRVHQIDAVVHFAALAQVGESVLHPLDYYENNVALTIGLLRAMDRVGVHRFVFSSTCAIYGDPERTPIAETAIQNPVSPYGRTKQVVEHVLADKLMADSRFSYAALRYFNAAGAAADGSLGEDHDPETHLIPLAIRAALGSAPPLRILGTDYATPDGTAIRDYVHVDDLGEAHLKALLALKPGVGLQCNLGTGRGYSVLEVLAFVQKVSRLRVPTEFAGRRSGDAPVLCADVTRAREVLGWSASVTSAEETVRTAWEWMRRHPHGYRDR